jgi:ketosteroid isomerase-like protein
MRTPSELANAVVAAIHENDGAALQTLFADDVVWWPPASAERFGVERPIRGLERTLTLLTGSLGLYRPGTTTWEVHHLVADDTHVAIGFTRRSQLVRGGSYENQYHLALRFADGLVVEGWEYADTAHAFAQFDRWSLHNPDRAQNV